MGGAGYARILCDECDKDLQTATLGRDIDEIKAAISNLGDKMASGNPDSVTYSLVSSLIIDATKRAKAIKAGTYDFSLDENEDEEGFDEIPEELLESEEDIALDKKDEENMKKFDKVYNIILIVALIALGGMIVWRLIQSFL
jgi:hypothetical protein